MSNATGTSKRKATPVSPRRRTPAGPQPAKSEDRRELNTAPFLTGAQEKIADAIGELIVTGGTRRNLELLCRIAADHEARRIWGHLIRNKPDELEKAVADRVANFAPKWYDQLAAARANRPHLPAQRLPEAKTVTDLIRAQKRSEVATYFKQFLAMAPPEDLWFMGDVMTDWDVQTTTWGDGYQAMAIVNAFEDQIGRDRQYVRVPRHLVEDVEKYIAALLVARPAGKEAA